jgi:hypothetical protein
MSMKKYKGFSLLIVMILSVVAMTLIGTALHFAVSSFGVGRTAVRSSYAYNILQSEIEKARSALKMEMASRKDAIKSGASGSGSINSIDDLEVLKNGVPFWRADYTKNVAGMNGNVSVRIYDMQYSMKDVASHAHSANLPPAVTLQVTAGSESEVMEPGMTDSVGGGSAVNAGVYLIRASIAFPNKITNKIDVAVIQNSNP